MGQLFIHSHATKHGLSKDQISHAWINAIEVARRENVDDTVDYVAIGFDRSGRAIEIVAAKNGDDYLIYHANTPPTARALRELRIRGGKHGRQRT